MASASAGARRSGAAGQHAVASRGRARATARIACAMRSRPRADFAGTAQRALVGARDVGDALAVHAAEVQQRVRRGERIRHARRRRHWRRRLRPGWRRCRWSSRRATRRGSPPASRAMKRIALPSKATEWLTMKRRSRAGTKPRDAGRPAAGCLRPRRAPSPTASAVASQRSGDSPAEARDDRAVRRLFAHRERQAAVEFGFDARGRGHQAVGGQVMRRSAAPRVADPRCATTTVPGRCGTCRMR